jgi:hypothetical protein
MSWALGMLGVAAIGPLTFVFDVCFWIKGDNWLDLVFPYAIIFMALFGTVLMQVSARLAVRSGLRGLRAFRILAVLLLVAFVAVFAINVIDMVRAKNDDIFSFYLMYVIFMGAGTPFAFIFLRTVFFKYRWFDPKALPSEIDRDGMIYLGGSASHTRGENASCTNM